MKNKTKIEDTIADIRKNFSEDAVVDLEGAPARCESLATGILGVDWAVGIGGFPKGRLTQIYGRESTAKTTIALTAIATAQKKGLQCAFIDVECALDTLYAEALGVDLKKLLILQPSSGEEAMQLIEKMLKDKTVGLIVLDSVAALATRAEIEGTLGDMKMAPVARLLASTLKVLIPLIKSSGAVVIFINQIREMTNMWGPGNPEYTPGGKALNFYCSVKLELKRIGTLKKSEEPVGTQIRVRVAKNKVAPPLKQVDLDVVFGEGVSHETDLISLGEKLELIKENTFNGVKLGRGKDTNAAFLIKNPETAQALEKSIRETMI